MSTSMSSALPENKTAGIALIAGVILTLFASLLYPGGVLIDSVDQTNFHGAIAAMSDNANITHAMTLLFILAILMEAYGLLALVRLVGRQGSLADTALRFGLGGIAFSWGLFIVELGSRHMVVHITQHGVGAGTGSEAQPSCRPLPRPFIPAGRQCTSRSCPSLR